MPRPSHTDLAMPELFSPQVFLGAEVERMKTTSGMARGAIYTRQEVVEFILDLAGYTVDKPLCSMRLLEPSFGSGDFLLSAIRRLLQSAQRENKPLAELHDAIRAVELHRDTFEITRIRLIELLAEMGVTEGDAISLADVWLINGDFLLENFTAGFDFVVGNPPYVRQEMISAPLLAEYRQRYSTLYDRADLYVPFIEQSLRLLNKHGVLGFICSDRWMKNRYGGPLREMVAAGYTLKYYVDMVGTAAFQSEVIAYPAITVIERGRKGGLRMAHRPVVSAESLSHLHKLITGPARHFNGTVIEMPCVALNSEPWLLEADAQPSLALVRRLETDFPTLEEAGCRVGIGVATGADKVFISPMDELDVEDERKLRLAMTRDLSDGSVQWRGLGVINPFEEDGSLADFAKYPRFASYMEKHAASLKARHCAQRANGSWYRTIDRITPSLAQTPKLLIPDIKGDAHVVLENAGLYPHHNLYYIVSKDWPLKALQAVLMSGIAHLFVRAYSTKMHGGALRFQAQYLRRIRLPYWAEIAAEDQLGLTSESGAILDIVSRMYRLTADERNHLNADAP
jgi:hypothetical protein